MACATPAEAGGDLAEPRAFRAAEPLLLAAVGPLRLHRAGRVVGRRKISPSQLGDDKSFATPTPDGLSGRLRDWLYALRFPSLSFGNLVQGRVFGRYGTNEARLATVLNARGWSEYTPGGAFPGRPVDLRRDQAASRRAGGGAGPAAAARRGRDAADHAGFAVRAGRSRVGGRLPRLPDRADEALPRGAARRAPRLRAGPTRCSPTACTSMPPEPSCSACGWPPAWPPAGWPPACDLTGDPDTAERS